MSPRIGAVATVGRATENVAFAGVCADRDVVWFVQCCPSRAAERSIMTDSPKDPNPVRPSQAEGEDD